MINNIRNKRILYYFNQYFAVRFGEKLYKYNHRYEKLYILHVLYQLTRNIIAAFIRIKFNDKIKKDATFKYLVLFETINQKNALIDFFEKKVIDRNSFLFVLSVDIFKSITNREYSMICFNHRKLSLLAMWYFPKAFCISRNYMNRNKGKIKRVDILLNLSLMMASVKLFKHYMSRVKCEKIIVTNDHNIYTLSLLVAAKNKGITSYYIQHASISDVFPKLLPDIALLEGQQSVDIYNKIGNYSKEIKLIGIPRMDGCLGYKTKFEKCKKVGICLKSHYSSDLIKKIIAEVKAVQSITEIILRPHPAYPIEAFSSFKGIDIDFSDARKERSVEFIKKIDVLISGESSIILEAALMRVRTLYIDDKCLPFDLYGYVKHGVTTFVDVQDIKKTIESTSFEDIQQNYNCCKYYCDTINTVNENKSNDFLMDIFC
jgi:hypothetical protein